MRSMIKLIVNAHPSYVPRKLLHCLRRLGGRTFLVMRCNVRDAYSEALRHVGHKRACRSAIRAIKQATTYNVLMNKRVVLKLPKRASSTVITRTKVLSSLPLSALGVRRLRLVHKAHVTRRCSVGPTSFRLFARMGRCVSLIVSCIRRLHPSVIMRHFISRSPGSLLVTPS